MTPPDESREFELIPNPYITGSPLRGREVFFGHEDDFAYVRQRLIAEKDGIVMLFVGARRSGKTSIMFQILEGRLGETFMPFFVDMQGLAGVVSGDREFFEQVAALVLEGVGDERLVAEYYDFAEGNPILTFDRLLGDIQQLFPDRRLVFLIDEAEFLKAKVDQGEFSGAVLTYMASVLESRRVSFCFTGSRGLGESGGAEWQWLMGKGDYREISFLGPEDTRRLIQQPVAGHVSYGEGVVDAIYDLTFGQPFYTQVICTYGVDYLNGVQRHTLEREDLGEVVRTIVENPPPQLIYEWDELNPPEQIAVSLLSEESEGPGFGVRAEELVASIRDNNYPLTLSEDALHITLEGLYERQWLDRDEAGAYHVQMDLFRQWIRRARSLWRLVEEQAPRKKKGWWLGIAAGGILGVAVAVGLWRTRVAEIEEIQQQQAARSVSPQTGQIWVDAERRDVQVQIGDFAFAGAPVMTPDLEPGRYAVEVRHPQYHLWRDTVVVAAGRTDSLYARLQRLTGTLTLTSQPAGARVSVRGEVNASGTTPVEGLELPTGEYEVSVRQPGFVEARHTVTVTDRADASLAVALTARVGNLYVVSDPPGAGILLNEQALGVQTPSLLSDLPVGGNRLVLERADYHRLDTTVQVRLGRTDTVALPLTLRPATLDLRSAPPGAAIFLDGADTAVGQTPMTLTLVPGRHRVRVTLAGHDPHAFEQEFKPGQSYPTSLTLQPQYGWIRIRRPLFGTVVISGPRGPEERTLPPNDLQLPVGVYRLTQKGKTESIEVEVTQGDTVLIMLP